MLSRNHDYDYDYEVYLSHKFDSSIYNTNHTLNFMNNINKNLIHGNGIGVFVRLQQVIVKGVNIDRFLVNLEGAPGCNTGGREDPVIGACTPSVSEERGINENESHSDLTRVYTFGDEGTYYPFSIGRMGVWHITLKAWGCEDGGVNSNSHCIIHLKVRTIVNRSMSLIHDSMYLKFDSRNGVLESGHLSQPLIINEGEKIGVTAGVIKDVRNIKNNYNIIHVYIKAGVLSTGKNDHKNALDHESIVVPWNDETITHQTKKRKRDNDEEEEEGEEDEEEEGE